MKQGIEIHPLTNHVYGHNQTHLRGSTFLLRCQCQTSSDTCEQSDTYLKSKFVEAEVDEVLDAGQDAVIQVLPSDALEDDAEGRNLQVVMETVVELVVLDSRLKHQQPKHHQMVLQHTKHFLDRR